MNPNRIRKFAVSTGLIFTAALLLVGVAAQAAEKGNAKSTAKSQGAAPHWTYHGAGGPENWGSLSSNFKTCSVGRNQSPIDIKDTDDARMREIKFHYRVTPLDLIHNGHTVQANYWQGSYITIDGKRFDLLQFHFHTPSEHKVGGQVYPMEIHFVHRNTSGQLAVVGVLITPGDSNLAAQEIWDNLPEKANAKVQRSRVLFNGRDLLPDDRSYFRYMGSLTTPPCSEGVNWYVLQNPVQFSAAQIDRLGRLMGYNARPVQQRNFRLLLKASGS